MIRGTLTGTDTDTSTDTTVYCVLHVCAHVCMYVYFRYFSVRTEGSTYYMYVLSHVPGYMYV